MRKKKNIILLSLLVVSIITFGQSGSLAVTTKLTPTELSMLNTRLTLVPDTYTQISPNEKIVWTKDEIKAIVTEQEEYDTAYFALYINVQTSHISDAILDYTKKVAKFGQKNKMTVYLSVQSGKPPGGGCVPGQPGCPK